MMNQEVKTGLNTIEVTGAVKEHKLKSGKADNGKYINGSLVIKTGDNSDVEVKVFVSEKTKKGTEKKAYTHLKSILDGEKKTMAEVSEEEAVKVRIYGSGDFTPGFKDEMFKNPANDKEVIEKTTCDLGFGNIAILDNCDKEKYDAVFDIEMFIENIKDEEKQDEKTGRIIIKGCIPTFNGSVIPMTIFAGTIKDEDGTEIDFAEQVNECVEQGMTVNFWGKINHQKIETKKTKGGSMGKAKVQTDTRYVDELVAIGADIIDEEKGFDAELIKQAKVNRENKKEEVKNKEEKKGSTKGKGMTPKSAIPF